MTVPAIEPEVILAGDGLNKVFPFGFPMGPSSTVQVRLVDQSLISEVVDPSEYSLTVGNPGGTVTFYDAPPVGIRIAITRKTVVDQQVSVTAQTAYDPKVVEAVWDKLTFHTQELHKAMETAIQGPPGSDPVDTFNTLIEASEDAVEAAGDAAEWRDLAKAWAQSPTEPDGPGTKSAKTWAGEAADSAELADSEGNATIALQARNEAEGFAETASTAAATAADDANAQIAPHVAAAEAAEAGAQLARAGAETAEANAESARDSAFVNAAVYADTAAGLAATTEGDQFQVVADDEIIRYRHDAGPVATEVARYPSAEKVDAIPAVIDKLSADAELLVDDAGSVIRRTDAHGHQFIPHMDGRSVQQQAAEDREAIHQGAGFRRRDVFQVEDDTGRITLRQDEDGGVYIPGLPGSIQAALGLSVGEAPRFPANPRDQLHDLIYPLTQNLVVQGLPYIDPPTMLVPNRYGVPDSFVSAFSVDPPDPARGLWLETPHGPGGLVHPYLLEMRRPLNGYRYLFGDTPHLSGSSEENPCLWGTNDLRNFTLWPGVRNPLGQPPMGALASWNADIGFAYDPRNGELICYWVGSDNSGAPHLHYRSTWDGVNWTPEMWVPDHAPGGTLSPAILYDPSRDVWHMWAVVTEGSVTHWTGPTYQGPWTQQSVVNFNTSFGIRAWHIEIKYLGDKFVMLANRRNDGCNLWLGVSADGDSWTFGPGLFQPQGPEVYKASFIPQWDGDDLRMVVAWNAYTFPRKPDVIQYLYIEPTNWIDTTTLS